MEKKMSNPEGAQEQTKYKHGKPFWGKYKTSKVMADTEVGWVNIGGGAKASSGHCTDSLPTNPKFRYINRGSSQRELRKKHLQHEREERLRTLTYGEFLCTDKKKTKANVGK